MVEALPIPNGNDLMKIHDGSRVISEYDLSNCVTTVFFYTVVLVLIVTTEGDSGEPYDFVSRAFDPWSGGMEDPVTGSAHTVLAPFWKEKFGGKKDFFARQCSLRGGELWLEIRDDTIEIKGKTTIILKGSISYRRLD